MGPGPTSIAGKITYDVINQIATFTPKVALATSSLFTATVTTGAMDLEGNALAVNFSWSFTTGSTPSLLPVDLERPRVSRFWLKPRSLTPARPCSMGILV